MKKKLILATSLALMLATAGTTFAAGHSSEMGRHGQGYGDQLRQEQCLEDGTCAGSEHQYGTENGSGDGVCDGTGSGYGSGDGVCDGTGSGYGSGSGICDGSCQE